MDQNLSPFFSARGVAIIGASPSPEKLSYGIVENMKRYGYGGKIYPVNPKYEEILGLKCYPDIAKVPDPVDLAVSVLPAQVTPEILEACGKRGLKAVTIISGGFREVGAEGAELENTCLEIVHRYKMRLIGPNCVGTFALHTGLNTTFINGSPDKGGIGFISQSGAVCGAIVDYISGKGVGFSYFISLGNEADVTETDMIEFLAIDENTCVICVYVEAIRDGRRFIDIARKVGKHKPIVLLKAGRSSVGARAVSSHTGSLAGAYAAYQAAFQQAGVIEASSLAELFDIALGLDFQPLPKGNRVAILTNAGGPAALASDVLAVNGMTLEDLEPKTKESLRGVLAAAAQVANPVDMLGGASPAQYAQALEFVLQDKNVDAVLPINVPTSLVNPADIAREISAKAKKATKPIIACEVGDRSIGEARKVFHQNHIPMVVFPETPGRIFGAMLAYSNWKKLPIENPLQLKGIHKEQAKAILDGVKKPTQGAEVSGLGESATRPLLQAYGIPLIGGDVAHSAKEAAKLADKMDYPVVLKIVSPDILHKSDVGGIKLNLIDAGAVEAAYEGMMKSIAKEMPKAKLEGALVEAMAPKGREVIVGMKRDPNFGPLMMFGLGGVYVELFKDVGFCIAPLTHQDAERMVNSTKAGALLAGIRGDQPSDIEAVVDCILRLSQIALDFPEIDEIEVNPLLVMAKGKGALALDGRVILV